MDYLASRKLITLFTKNIPLMRRKFLHRGRSFATVPPPQSDNESWEIHSYGDISELTKSQTQVPILRRPDQVLVKVEAASVNPIDVAMLGGYGASALNILRQAEALSMDKAIEFPLTLGRDFAGRVEATGQAVSGLSVGDQVWGVLSPHQQGSHSRHVVVSCACVDKKPNNLSMVEASSLVYAAMTAWSALQVTGGLAVLGASGRKVLVLGSSGGVGTAAVQMLNSWGAIVTATCRTDAVPLVQALGVPCVVDYTQPDFHKRLAEISKYDLILDCAGLGTEGGQEYHQHLSENPLAKYVTLKSPLLREMDSRGVVAGAISSFTSLIQANLRPGLLPRLAPVRWAFFMPLPPALRDISSLAASGKLVPCVDSVYSFNETPEAFKKVKNGHVRGKVVIDLKQTTSETS